MHRPMPSFQASCGARLRMEGVVHPFGGEFLRDVDCGAQLAVWAHLAKRQLVSLAGHLGQYGQVGLGFGAFEDASWQLHDLLNQMLAQQRTTHAAEPFRGDQAVRQDQTQLALTAQEPKVLSEEQQICSSIMQGGQYPG